MLRIVCKNNNLSPNNDQTIQYTFIFISDKALKERDLFKEGIMVVINKQKELSKNGTQPVNLSQINTPSPSNLNNQSNDQRSITEDKIFSSINSPYVMNNMNKKDISKDEIKIRQELLINNKKLSDLHQELVIGGFISEEEFWETRKVFYNIYIYI